MRVIQMILEKLSTWFDNEDRKELKLLIILIMLFVAVMMVKAGVEVYNFMKI